MKYLLLLFTLILPLCASSDGTINLTISNIENGKGVLSVAIYGTEGTFGKEDGVVKEVQVAPKRGSVSTQITLPAGDYAIIILHDENKNKEMDTGFMGMPKEGYGCSNNKMSLIGIPKRDKSLFSLNAGSTQNMTITLRN